MGIYVKPLLYFVRKGMNNVIVNDKYFIKKGNKIFLGEEYICINDI